MNSPDNWEHQETSEETVENLWRHEEGEEVRVERFEDDNTWDAFFNDRLIENFDSVEEAQEKASELLNEFESN